MTEEIDREKYNNTPERLGHLSPSSLDTWFDCQRKFLYQHLLRTPYTTSWQAFGGQIYHKALEYFYSGKARTGKTMKESVLVDKTREYYDFKMDNEEITFAKDSPPESVWKNSTDGAKLHIKDRGRFIMPGKNKEGEPLVEISATKPIPNTDDVSVTGRIDLVTDDFIIADHKTKNMKKWARKLTVKSMEEKHAPKIYRHLIPESIGVNWEVTLLYKDGTEPSTYTLQYPPYNPPKTMDTYLSNVVSQIQHACDSGIFLPHEAHWICDSRWCSYWDMCRGKGE